MPLTVEIQNGLNLLGPLTNPGAVIPPALSA